MFQAVSRQHQLYEDLHNVSLGWTQLWIQSPVIAFCQETWLSTHMNPKDGCNYSNHNPHNLPQVINFQCHILRITIQELNLLALTWHRENNTAAYNVRSSGSDLAALLSSQSWAQPAFMGPWNHDDDGKHSYSGIKDLRALRDNERDPTHHAAIYCGMPEFILCKSGNRMYISDKQLYAMDLCIYHGLKLQLGGLEGEPISQMCQYTGSQSWGKGDWLNDRVWITQYPGRCYGELNGCLSCQPQWLYKIKLQDEDGASVEYWLALGLTTIPENSGNLDRVTKFVQVSQALAAFAFQVLGMGNFARCTVENPEIVTSSDPWDGRNE
jgi:hypothetical protein